MKFEKVLFIILIIHTIIFFYSCNGTANVLMEENATISFNIIWPTRLIPEDSTDIAIFLSNDNMQSYKKGILISKSENSTNVQWKIYPGDYTISIIALKLTSTTSTGLKNFVILTGDVQKLTLLPNEVKNLSVFLNYLSISAALNFNPEEIFYITSPIPIKFYIDDFYSILKFSGGKLYFTYNNGFKNITEYKTIYVSNTEEVGDGYFNSIVYPDSSGYPSESFDLSVYAKFTVSSEKIASDFMSFYQINEIKIEISDYQLGQLEDGTSSSYLNIIIQ